MDCKNDIASIVNSSRLTTPSVPTPNWDTESNEMEVSHNEKPTVNNTISTNYSINATPQSASSSSLLKTPILSSQNFIPGEVALTPTHSAITPQSINPHSSMTALTPMVSGTNQARNSVKVQNCVSTVHLGCELKLLDIYCRTRYSEYNPARFHGVVMKIIDPRATALVFRSGKVLCTGLRNEHDSYIAARKFSRIIQKLGYQTKFLDFKIQNFIATADLRFPIRLEALQQAHGQFASYEPELFPGLVYRMVRPRVVLLIFVNGKIVFTVCLRIPIHRFPNPEKHPVLFAAWIEAIGDERLREIDPMKVYSGKRVCDHHFETVVKISTSRLSPSAIPSVNICRVEQSLSTFVEADHSHCPLVRDCGQVRALRDVTNITSSVDQKEPSPGPSGWETTSTITYNAGGRMEEVHIDKITSRIKKLCYGLNMDFVDPVCITLKVINGIYSGVTTVELDNLAAETAATMTTDHPDYAILAARLVISNLHKETKKHFSDVMTDLYNIINPHTKKRTPMISDYHYNIIIQNKERLDSAIVYDRDFKYNYFGFKTLERSYLLKINNKVAERPQHMLMRVSIGIHGEDIDSAIHTYNLLSEKYFTHASPTLFSAATPRPQLSSCFLIAMKDDSIEGIYDTLKQCALISKSAGGIGLHVHNIRAKGSYIAGTNGISNGLVPMLRVYNNTARYVDQGGNKRPGAFAIYLEPWHSDVFEFLDLRKNTGKEEVRARELFYALWIPDLFMKRVEKNENWSLMCPHECPGLSDGWGDEFEALYRKYEKEGRFVKQVRAQVLWKAIIEAQVETGTPFMLYKDSCNRKSNQKNLGTIKCSNLCTEIVEYTSSDEVAVCNLASIALNMYVNDNKTYNFTKLKEVTKTITQNLNKIIDVNYYPVPEARNSNMRHRPIGIGVQGLADAFILMRIPYESDAAIKLNQQIFETIYYGALEASCELAEKLGAYETYEGCPASQGILQYDMWNKVPTDLWDWAALKEKIAKHGLRNSLLLAPMPTASTAQILGNNESFEPFTSNIYQRRVLSGEFQVVNHHLLHDLTEADLWDEDMKNLILHNNGSIQNIEVIPKEIRDLYKTVWEISVKTTIQMAADRGAFIDQSQSFNIHVAEPNYGKLTSIHFHAWKMGLKTGMYYLRTKPAANAIQFTVDKSKVKGNIMNGRTDLNRSESDEANMAAISCSLQNKDDCLSCGS